jgi:hypothetical protein
VEPDLKTVKKKPTELVYDFIIIPGTGLGIREQRELKLRDGRPVAKSAQPPIPDATAFTTAVTVLLREIRDKFTFSYTGTANLDGREALIIDYVPAIRRPPSATWEGSRFRFNFESKGRIWIDPASYDVLRLETHLLEPVEFQPPRVIRKGPFLPLRSIAQGGIVPSDSRIPRSSAARHAFIYELPTVFERSQNRAVAVQIN